MTTATLPATEPALPPIDPEDFDHAFCCDRTRAVCGADLIGDCEEVDRDKVTNPCPTCEALEAMGGPCEAKGCTR